MKIGKVTTPDAVYELIYWFIENSTKKAAANLILFGNLQKLNKLISWELTEEALELLFQCVNGTSGVTDDVWKRTQDKFLMAAFKDLSPMRNPHAMRVFQKIRVICNMNKDEALVWGRKTIERPDGSAVVIIHVSDLETFNSILRGQSAAKSSLETGLIIHT